MQWIKRNWLAIAFVVINLAIAAPAEAGFKNSTCSEPGGGEVGCCATCWFFCGCDYLE